MDILDKINILIGERKVQPKLAGKANAMKKSYERKKYRKTKHKKKQSLEKLKRSGEGNKREKRKDRLEKVGRTPTDKRKTRYHV